MNTFKTIINLLTMAHTVTYKREITIDELATLLKIDILIVEKMIQRNKIPYEIICNYCNKNGISINHIFYNQNSIKSIYYFPNVYIGGSGCSSSYKFI